MLSICTKVTHDSFIVLTFHPYSPHNSRKATIGLHFIRLFKILYKITKLYQKIKPKATNRPKGKTPIGYPNPLL